MPMKKCAFCGVMKSWNALDPEPVCSKCKDKPQSFREKIETKKPEKNEGSKGEVKAKADLSVTANPDDSQKSNLQKWKK